MNSKELRPGNLVLDSGTIREVISSGFFKCELEHPEIREYYASTTKLEPVPLNNHLIVGMGFSLNDFGDLRLSINPYDKGVKELVFSPDYLFLKEGLDSGLPPSDVVVLWNKNLRKEFYVHELQNLIFDLTKDEV